MKSIPVLGVITAALALASPAFADSPDTTAFGGAVNCITRAAGDATAGQRWCQGDGNPSNVSVVPSFDGTPIDVGVAFPPKPASGPDGKFPVVGIYSGYGSAKILASDSNTAQRWLSQGYAVFAITNRGFWGSCGVLVQPKPPACAQGYIHLMSNAFEVRDAQYMLGLLADGGLIDPNKIGANGGSYGGGLSMALATLKDRTQLPDGTLVPWTSPGGLPLHIAAAAPEYGWSDLIASLQPNGSALDYAAQNPYLGPNGERRFGIQKLYWNTALYNGGAQTGYYAAPGSDPAADITSFKNFNDTGGPYDGQALAAQQTAEFPKHASLATDSSIAPAPMLISNGWNDDLFPVTEGVKIYNRVRALHPDAPISLYDINYGHPPRGGSPPVSDVVGLYIAQSLWFAKYVKGSAIDVPDSVGGVTIATSACDASNVPAPGTTYRAKSWAALSPGEVRVDGAAAQTVAPGTAPAASYESTGTTVCTDGPAADTSGAAVYSTGVAPASGYTIAGSPTVLADLTVAGANDQLISRLLDVDGAGNEKLIARGIYRPTGVQSTTRQVFQLYPQAWKVAAGHRVKLELLSSDAPYARPATGQNPVGVANLQLRLPTIDGPGAADGLVQTPLEKVLPSGYTLARDVVQPTPAVTNPAPVVTPPPVVVVPKDPITLAAARTALGKNPRSVKVTRTRSSLTFTDTIPEPGTVTYKLSIDVKKGKKLRRYTLGTVTKKVLSSGKVTVKITVTKSRRTLLKQHPKSKVVLATTLRTAIQGQQVSTTRKFAARP